MAMDQAEIAMLRRVMDYEKARTAPPPSFPKLPDIPGGRYTDPRFEALEHQQLWRRSWLIAAHIDELPRPGCFRLWETAGQPVVLVHARTGAINAFYNTCSHRGAPVVTEESGRKPRLVCRYHGWSYDDEGALVGMRDPEDFADFDASCRSLTKIRCERLGNLIFVNFDPEAPSLKDYLGAIWGELDEFQFDKVRLVDRYTRDVNCNWKIAMEANMEVYHVPNIHPATVAMGLDHRQNVNTLYPNGHGRMIAPGWERNKPKATYASVMDGTRPEVETVGEIARTCTQSYNIFPNFVMPLSPAGWPIISFWPDGPDKSKVEVWWLGADWGEGPRPAEWDRVIPFFNIILSEDTEFGTWIQKSQQSYGFKGVPLSYQEARIYHWHQAADRLIGEQGTIPDELKVKPVLSEDWIHPNDPRLEELDQLMAAE